MDPAPSGNRLVATTPDNHQAWLWFTHVYSLICVLIAGAIRAWRKRRRVASSDAVLLIAHLLYIVYWILIVLAATNSLGKSLRVTSDLELSRASKYVFASRILLAAIIDTAKLSTLLLMEEVFTKDMMRRWITILLALAACQTLVGPIVLSVACSPSGVLLGRDDNGCSASAARWSLFTVFEALLECLLLIPVTIIMLRLQTTFQVRLWAVSVFAARLIILIPAGLHLSFYIRFIRDGTPNIDVVPTIVTEQIWAALALIVASLPIIMRVTKKFTTSGLILTPKSTSSLPAKSRTQGSLHTIGAQEAVRGSDASSVGKITLRCDDHGINTTHAMGGRQRSNQAPGGDEGASTRSSSHTGSPVGIRRKVGFNVSWEHQQKRLSARNTDA